MKNQVSCVTIFSSPRTNPGKRPAGFTKLPFSYGTIHYGRSVIVKTVFIFKALPFIKKEASAVYLHPEFSYIVNYPADIIRRHIFPAFRTKILQDRAPGLHYPFHKPTLPVTVTL